MAPTLLHPYAPRFRRRAAFVAAVVLVAGAPSSIARPGPAENRVAWTFRAEFSHGLTGWMSFPLAQDIGFDPSLYTVQDNGRTILVRDMPSLGSATLQLGVIRPFAFWAGSSFSLRLEYALSTSGQTRGLEVSLAGADGHRYRAPLPHDPGTHRMQIAARELGLPIEGAEIQAIAIVGRIDAPQPAAHERLTISEFVLQGERRRGVELAAPVLERSEVGSELVARTVTRIGSALRVRAVRPGVHVRVEDGSGRGFGDVDAPDSGDAVIALGSSASPGLWTARVTSGGGETDFRFLVVGSAPPHPRILLTAARLEQLRRGPQYSRLRDQIHVLAERVAGEIAFNEDAGSNIARLPTGTALNAAFVGELKAYFKLLESYANAIAYNALDYSLNGNDAAAALARRALHAVARWETWTPPRFQSHGSHTYYEVGVFAQRVALGYDLIAPRLAPEEKLEIARAFRRHVIEPTVREYFSYNRMPLAASNWMANSLGGAMAASVALEGDVPDWEAHEGAALAVLTSAFEQVLNGLFPGDGSEVEPAGYENFARQGLSWSMGALDALGIRARGTDRAFAGFWWPSYAMVTPSLVLDSGDFDGRLEKLTGFAWAAEHADIPALRDFYDRSSTYVELSSETEVGHTGRTLEQTAGPLDLVCCSKPPASVAPAPPSRVFPKRGSAVLRSGWEADATVISLRAGPWFNHEHHDEGSFQVAAFGEHLIAEAGYTGYYDDPNYPTYFTQAPGHNTVLLDADAFSQTAFNGCFWPAMGDPPAITNAFLGVDVDYVATNLAPAYAGQLDEYTREFVFLKPDLLIVRDRIRSAARHAYSWLLHPPAGAAVSTSGTGATIRMPHASASVLAAGPNAWKLRSRPISITKYDDLEHGVIQMPRELYLESPRDAAAQFVVGLALAKGPAAGGSDVMRTISGSAGEGIGRDESRSRGVVFRSRPGPLKLSAFATDGSVLASSSALNVFAAQAMTISDGDAAVFRSTKPVDLSWRRSASGLDIQLHASDAADVQVAVQRQPASVLVDGKAAPMSVRGGTISLRGLTSGEHRVAVTY